MIHKNIFGRFTRGSSSSSSGSGSGSSSSGSHHSNDPSGDISASLRSPRRHSAPIHPTVSQLKKLTAIQEHDEPVEGHKAEPEVNNKDQTANGTAKRRVRKRSVNLPVNYSSCSHSGEITHTKDHLRLSLQVNHKNRPFK